MEVELGGDAWKHLGVPGWQVGQALGTGRRACGGDSHPGAPGRRAEACTGRGRRDQAGQGPH